MAYQMVATVVTLNDLKGHSSVAGLFKCNLSNIYAAFYTISTDSVLARFLCISRTARPQAAAISLKLQAINHLSDSSGSLASLHSYKVVVTTVFM